MHESYRHPYSRAEYLFKQASRVCDPHGQGWTLHQLRHSTLSDLAAAGRTAPELQAKSREEIVGAALAPVTVWWYRRTFRA
ncbi:hypothetical protein GCM10009678_74160 [Actinomadura kijaniata]|uniref:Integrase n=1 Tax=Actinomadura namibiensis TaxID=182080 RepID=A0A7W3QN33_ACTNM|nr:hypothetical protein [Actinomadura namibiensis]MBA8953159.1 hypothetical protein [Actinomadura namibiensis]